MLCVDRCHSELAFTDSLKHQTKPLAPEGTGPWAESPVSPASFRVPVTQEITYWKEGEPSERASWGLEVLVPSPWLLCAILPLAGQSLLEAGG